MRNKLGQLCEKLSRDGVNRHNFVLIAYALIWFDAGLSYADILDTYAEYVGDAPERVHADMCYRLLSTGKEIGPEEYINGIKVEVFNENGISSEQGSGAGTCSIDP